MGVYNGGGRDYEQKRYSRSVYDLCNKAAAGVLKHGKCHKKRMPPCF